MHRYWSRLFFVLTIITLLLMTTCTKNSILLSLESPEIRITYSRRYHPEHDPLKFPEDQEGQ